MRQTRRCVLALIVISGCLYGLSGIPISDALYQSSVVTAPLRGISRSLLSFPETASSGGRAAAHAEHFQLKKVELQQMLDRDLFLNARESVAELRIEERPMVVRTSLDPALQGFLLEKLDRRHARYIAIVVMEPKTGRIRAMVGYDRANPHGNPCTESRFPAASVFKIVTAAAALESCGFGQNTTFAYCGNKYTLYKSQLRRSTSRPVRHITLKDSFAQSVNPVFGKLGLHHLKKGGLVDYAGNFGFNREIPFELPLDASHFVLEEEPYQWAEIASGFNRTTTISPVHGAMIAAAVGGNQGRMMEPGIIDEITDCDGNPVYTMAPRTLGSVLSPSAALALRRMMAETIQSGTCRKTFRKADSDPVLSRLWIGGKTGSINSRTEEALRYDWFVGFAEDRQSREQLAVSALVGHKNYIGTRAKQYAKMVMSQYYARYFAQQDRKRQEHRTNTEEKQLTQAPAQKENSHAGI